MHIDIQTRGFTLTEGLRSHCERRMRFALGPSSSRLSAISVRLTDVNGPRGGVDKRVIIKATLPGAPPVVVGHDEPDIYVAIGRANTPTAPFTAILNASLSLADTSEGLTRVINTNNTGDVGAIAFDATYIDPVPANNQPNRFFYGRLRLQNANGPMAITLPIMVFHFSVSLVSSGMYKPDSVTLSFTALN